MFGSSNRSGPAVCDAGAPGCRRADYNCNCGECLSRRGWIERGFTLDQAAAWTAAGYATPDAAAVWTVIGIDDPAVAEQWSDAGFTPESAARWTQIEDMTPSEAATCANGGLSPVDVERIRRADPSRTLTEAETAGITPDRGIDL